MFLFAGIIGRCMWATLAVEYFRGVCANNLDARSPIIGWKMRERTLALVAASGSTCTKGDTIAATVGKYSAQGKLKICSCLKKNGPCCCAYLDELITSYRCSRFESKISRLGILKPVRVCQGCYSSLRSQSNSTESNT